MRMRRTHVCSAARLGSRATRCSTGTTRTSCAPDFTARHGDGREALIEIVGFWTPGDPEDKLRKLHAARASNLMLVVYRGLASGGGGEALEGVPGAEVVWFENKPRVGAVMEAVERMGRMAADNRVQEAHEI